MNRDELKKELHRDEGERRTVYKDSVGKLTLGIGHNVEEKPISERVVSLMLEDDIDDVERDLDRNLPWWRTLSEPRQRALANMCFNLGAPRLLNFQKALEAMQGGDFTRAADEMLQSRWAIQVGMRAMRLANLMRAG